ncbi:MAG: extracellular solute-binding protein [Clostridia bacterium]|nr:extracellular solute-binding protein [Clostridia bacterium]
MKKLVALFMTLVMVLLCVPVLAENAPTVIRMGTHWKPELDPHNIDETTGNFTIGDEEDRLIRIAAEDAVREKYNVEIEYVQYAQDTRSELVLSVLAGNPVCDLALMWNGSENTVLAQNILQPLDKYVDLYDGAAWMLPDKVYGHNYFLNANQSFTQYFSLLVNLTMLEQVDALKDADGNTIYPTDLLEKDEWTWSTFKDYLTKIQAFYGNTPAPDGAKVSTVQAYETDHRYATLSAMYANGGAIYGAKGLQVNSKESIEAVQYIKSLRDAGVMVDCGVYDDGYTPQWCESGNDFGRGATVFAECPIWMIKSHIDECTARGESVALMPWPRPDNLAKDSEDYRQVISVGDIWGVLKGIDEEKTELAVKVFRTYWETYYELKAHVADMSEYKEAMAETEAMKYGLDIFNEKLGDGILNAFIFNSEKCVPNDFANLLGMRDPWDRIVGKGFYGVEGMPSYEVAIEANMNQFTDTMAQMEAILGSNELHDNQAPSVAAEGYVSIAKGENLETMVEDWSIFFHVEDGFDGIIDPMSGTFDTSKVDVNTVGKYTVKGIYADKAGNEGSAKVPVIVFDAENKTAPTVTMKEELPPVAMDTNVLDIDWAGKYVESAVSADGLDLMDKITANVSELDTSTPGEYPVEIVVTDYNYNTANVTITVSVVAE